jgi:hypothetical protein
MTSVARYDDRGNQIEGAYLGTDGKPATVDRNGVRCSRWIAVYDDGSSNLLKKTFFDVRSRVSLPELNFTSSMVGRMDWEGLSNVQRFSIRTKSAPSLIAGNSLSF